MKTALRTKSSFSRVIACMMGEARYFFRPVLIGWLLMAAITAPAATYYVSPTGSDANNGTSWTLAKQTIQAGITVATSGDTILVADGTYILTSQIEISPGVTVRSVNGAQTTIIDGGGVRSCAYLYSSAVLDGFMVKNGYASWVGGGICIDGGSVKNCVISGNTAMYGGGVFVWHGTVENCTISGNTASSDGGGVYMYDGMVENCTISGNTAVGMGGGVISRGGTVENCTISGNSADNIGGGLYVGSTWPFVQGGTVQNCTISENTTAGSGGGAFIDPCGTVKNCTISGNIAYRNGGGVGMGWGTLENCTISGNTCYGSAQTIYNDCGGGVYVLGGTVRYCTITENIAYSHAGGAFLWDGATMKNCVISGNHANSFGGGVVCISGGTLENCTISGNSASDGGGVCVYGYGITVQNCIAYYNQNGDVIGPISYSCIGTGDIGGVGNITNEPQFVSNGTGYGTNLVPGNYRLRPTSPCINAGINQSWMINATDLDGLSRILDGVVDMGAYECPGTNSAIMRSPAILYNQCDYGSNATGQTIHVWNGGMGAMVYALSPNVHWLSISPASGTSTGETDLVNVHYASTGLAPGTYTGIVTITSAEASNSPQVVTVYLWVDNDDLPENRADIEVSEFKWVPKVMQKLEHPSVISFVLRNDGPADMKPPDTTLEARFYLSGNMIFGDGDDIWVGTKQGDVTLAAGEQMTVRYSGQTHNTDVTIPDGISGDYYVFMSVVHVLPSRFADPDGAYAMRDGPITIGKPSDGEEDEERNRAVVNDYDGDGQSDMMEYDEASGEWAIRLSESGKWVRFVFGGPGYETASGDYDGDCKVDPAVHHKKGSQWYLMLSGMEYQPLSFDFGGESETKGTAGDYNGDGLAEPGLYEERSGQWYVLLPNTEHGNYEMASVVLGGPGYTPVAGDYDGDGRTDPAVYEEETGEWRVMLSVQGYGVQSADLGGPGYRPVPGDYDGDGKTDLAIMSASGGWYYRLSSRGYSRSGPDTFSQSGRPVPGDYDGDGKADPAIIDASGNWYFWLSSSFYIRAGPYYLVLP